MALGHEKAEESGLGEALDRRIGGFSQTLGFGSLRCQFWGECGQGFEEAVGPGTFGAGPGLRV